MLQQAFLNIVQQYAGDDKAETLWAEIDSRYSRSKRYYHTLTHLQNLYHQLLVYKPMVQHWDVLVFSICYHDIVYNVLKHDNEEKSAVFAGKRLISINVPLDKIEICKAQIIATKAHAAGIDNDTNLFTDADLSILGSPWEVYAAYCAQVRKEYSIYPDMVYKPGRRKVLQHFLQMERIFKTEPFFNKFEQQARKNLVREIESLNN